MNYSTNKGKAQVAALEKIAKMGSTFITPTQAAPALGCSAYCLSVMAREEKTRSAIGFPVIRVGNRTKIPRLPFLRVMGWENNEAVEV